MDLIRAGRSLYLSERPGAAPHLWLVLTDPYGDPPEVVLAMVRTRKRYTDDTVILQVGDHPFIRHESCVHYSDAERFPVALIMKRVAENQCELRTDMSAALLARARQGLRDSPFTVNAVRDYCVARWGR